MLASKLKSDNLITIIDRNILNMEGETEESMLLEPLRDKWESFGWEVKTIGGHNIRSLYKVLSVIPFK